MSIVVLVVFLSILASVICENINITCSTPALCAHTEIHCNNATICNIICSVEDACTASIIYHSSFNHQIQIHCLSRHSCNYLTLQYEPNMDVIPSINKSFILNSLVPSASTSITLSDIATFSELYVNCFSELSCYNMEININNPNFTNEIATNLNLTIDIHCSHVSSCKYLKLHVSKDWNNMKFTNVQWDNFLISLYCNNTLSCQHASIDTHNLQINSRRSSLSFADVFIYCMESDSTCLYLNIICPDLIKFSTIYDHLYQDTKCHITLMNSYQNQIQIISKHGAQMVDINCNNNDSLICEGVTVHCTENSNSYYCGMQYNKTQYGGNWYCDNYEIYYVFNHNYSYGCDEYIWLDNIAIIETSKIPNYENEAVLSCSRYNPSPFLHECHVFCDSDYACLNDIRCDNSTKCYIECIGLESCNTNSWATTIYCPNNPVNELNDDIICNIYVNPVVLESNYGRYYDNYFIYAYNQSIVDATISHLMSSYIFDFGMKSANLTILNSDNLIGWNEEYDIQSWWKVINMVKNETEFPSVLVNILCDRCYVDWLEVNGYNSVSNRNMSVYLSCIQCVGTEFSFRGIKSFEGNCYGNCSFASLEFTDTDAEFNCYQQDGCSGVDIYLKPSNVSSYTDDKYLYQFHLLQESPHIAFYSWYGFKQLIFDCTQNGSLCNPQLMDISFHCGYPDYFNTYYHYNTINETNCLQSNSLYASSIISLFEWQYSEENITAEIIYCSVYKSCHAANIHCAGVDCVIYCDGKYSCQNSRIYTHHQTQNSLKVYCTDYKACYYMKIHSNLINYVEINCMSAGSCASVTVYNSNNNHSDVGTKGLNITCYDIRETQAVIAADHKYQWPSCRRLEIYCPFIGCNVKLQNSLYADPYGVNIYYPQGFSELNLQCFFNNLTKVNTCYDVEYYCNLPDSKNAYDSTSYQYLSTFDKYNGSCIGGCCHYIFSHSPTTAPTIAPSLAPFADPTSSPTESPTSSPTRYPTSFQFDSYFSAKFYIISYPSLYESKSVIHNNIKESLEYSYLPASASWSYSEYLINITNITLVVNSNTINFTMQMFSDSQVLSHYIQYTQNSKDFQIAVSDVLQNKWNISNITFGLYPDSVVVIGLDKNVVTNLASYDYGSIVFISFASFIWIIAFISLLHTKNKLKCLNKISGIKACDDQQYANVISYGMQILDLYSDVAFSWELYEFSKSISNRKDHLIITILYWLSFSFWFIPWSINLMFAVMFEKCVDAKIFNIAHRNKHRLSIFTRNYFFTHSKVFAIFVIISGSVSATLQLINSRLFGHELFLSGFSKSRLSKMGKFRIVFTVAIENIPQFILQLAYYNYFNGMEGHNVVTFTFVVSTCCSIISILSSIMAYFVQRSHQPQYQTKFNIEITLIENAVSAFQIDRVETVFGDVSKSILKIEVLDKNVKKLHKRSNLRKVTKQNVAKCIGKLADNFEFLYCIEQIDGLTLHGLCSSDGHTELDTLFQNHKAALQRAIMKIYKLNKKDLPSTKFWKVDFIVYEDEERKKSVVGVEMMKIRNNKQHSEHSEQTDLYID
eukprot:325178_1